METRSFGPATERLVRAALFMMLADVFALMFFWDGYIGYQLDNAVQVTELLGLTETETPSVNPRVTRERATRLAKTATNALTSTAMADAFGAASLEHDETTYYVGPCGWLSVTQEGGKITKAEWTDGKHTESDQQWQRYIAYALALASLYATYGFMTTAASRITLSDEGLRIFGRPAVGWDALTGINRGSGGVVTVEVADAKSIEIDRYVYKNADQLVESICERKGFANPLKST